MKARLNILILSMLLPIVAVAQNTVEAFIQQCPPFIPVSVLATYHRAQDNEAAMVEVQEWYEKYNAFEDKFDTFVEREQERASESMRKAVEKKVENEYGMSAAELQSMSDDEAQAFGMKEVEKQLQQSGLGNMSLADLQALEGKSDAEIMAAMQRGGVTIGGMDVSEIMAMEGMSDQEIAAYMQQGNRMERMSEAFSQDKLNSLEKSSADAGRMLEISEEINRIYANFNHIRRQNEKEQAELKLLFGEINDRTEAQIPKPTLPITDNGVILMYIHTDAEIATIEKLWYDCDTECYTLWHNYLTKVQGRLKSMLPDAYRLDELNMELSELQGAKADGMSATIAIASDYLETATAATSYPIDHDRDRGIKRNPNNEK